MISIYFYTVTSNSPFFAKQVGFFAWSLILGMETTVTVLAVWLVTRSGVWRSGRGWLCVVTYIIAFAYGRMLFSSTQTWWLSLNTAFRFPGNEFADFSRPMLDILSLMMTAWLLLPFVSLAAMSLCSTDQAPKRTQHFSISGMIGFTMLAAIVLVSIRFLTSDFAPQTYYSERSEADAIKEWVGDLPFRIPPLMAAIMILFGLMNRRRLLTLAFLGAVALDGIGSFIVAGIAEQVTGQKYVSIPGNTLADYTLFVCGRSIIVGAAFSTAILLGVRPSIGYRNPQNNVTEPDNKIKSAS
jgi:hypothetical protein